MIVALKNWISQHLITFVIGSSLVVVAIAYPSYRYFSNELPDEVFAVERSTLKNEVRFSGSVEPADEVSLGFELQGKLQTLSVDVGDTLRKGQVIATLSDADARSDVAQARAVLSAEVASLDSLIKGVREEEIQVKVEKVASYEQSLNDALQALSDEYIDAYTVAENAVRNSTDQLFDSPRLNPQLKFDAVDYKLANGIEQKRIELENLLLRWSENSERLRSKMTTAFSTPTETSQSTLFSYLSLFIKTSGLAAASTSISSDIDYEAYSLLTRNNLTEIKLYLESLSLLVNSLTTSASLSQEKIDTWRAAVSASRTQVVAQLSALSIAEEKRNIALSNISVAKEEVALLKAGTTPEKLREQQARVDAQRALVQKYESLVSKHALISPIAGTVTAIEISEGELVSAFTPLITIASDASFEIKADVSEIDIVGLNRGMEVIITLDAYGPTEEFMAVITDIDPAEKKIDGISAYGVTLQLKIPDDRVYSGMTANARTQVVVAEDVLSIPRRFLIKEGGDYYVHDASLPKDTKRAVTIGRQTNGGMVEIVSGLNDGDIVARFEE
jgi:multidrug efflux pump subunit AcrA (membrane-fusion protein)